jgi:hypothetical protein
MGPAESLISRFGNGIREAFEKNVEVGMCSFATSSPSAVVSSWWMKSKPIVLGRGRVTGFEMFVTEIVSHVSSEPNQLFREEVAVRQDIVAIASKVQSLKDDQWTKLSGVSSGDTSAEGMCSKFFHFFDYKVVGSNNEASYIAVVRRDNLPAVSLVTDCFDKPLFAFAQRESLSQ